MSRPIKTALVVFKKSAWEHHVAGRGAEHITDAPTRRAMLKAHEQHLKTLDAVKAALEKAGVKFRATSRAELHPSRKSSDEPDLFVSVGGDGTFLETSHQIRNARLLGVNSSPEHSVGYFCGATRKDFADVLDRALAGKLSTIRLHRLDVRIRGRQLPHLALNDVLLTHQNPGATSRYVIRVGDKQEQHRSSGVWFATAAGSTAGIRAAGGKLLPIQSDRLQFAVREIYVPPGERPFKLKAGVLPAKREIRVICRMVDGAVFIDGPRHRYPVGLGDEIRVRMGNQPLQVLGFDATRRAR